MLIQLDRLASDQFVCSGCQLSPRNTRETLTFASFRWSAMANRGPGKGRRTVGFVCLPSWHLPLTNRVVS